MKLKLLKQLTEADCNQSADFAVEMKRRGKRGKKENWITGIKGEIAYGFATNQLVNFECYDRGIGDGGIDFLDGAQIKTRELNNKCKPPYLDLLIKKNSLSFSNPKVTKFVLLGIRENRVYILGEISKESFWTKKDTIDLFPHSWAVNCTKLDVKYFTL